jgi:hypothetical protein
VNANALWAGNDYALVEGRGRNDPFDMHAKRVKVKRVFKQQVSDRARTMVEVIMCDDKGEELMRYGEQWIRTVRAREIIDHWDEYEHERNTYKKEIEERERAAREAQEQREALRRIREEELQHARTRILDALEARGIPRRAVTIGTYDSSGVTISKPALERWLGLVD